MPHVSSTDKKRKNSYDTFIIESWRQFRETAAGPAYRNWAFRGHADSRWALYSSLSRYLMSHNIHPEAWPGQEARILRIFQRKRSEEHTSELQSRFGISY